MKGDLLSQKAGIANGEYLSTGKCSRSGCLIGSGGGGGGGVGGRTSGTVKG